MSSPNRLVCLESVRRALEANKLSFEEYKDWPDEQVVNRLLSLLREKPKKGVNEGAARLPEWIAKYHTEEEEPEEVSHLPEWLTKHRSNIIPLVYALGDCKSSDAVKPLSQALASSDEYVVAAAARSLGKIGDVAVVNELMPLLSHEEKRVRVATAEGLARLGQPEGFEMLRQMMRQREKWREERFQTRAFFEVECAKVLYELGDHSGIGLLVEHLNHPSFLAVALALRALEDIKAPDCVQAVRRHISRESSKTNILTCARILAKLGDLSELHWITEMLVAGNPTERQLAADSCRRLGFTVFLEPLRKRQEIEGNEKVRDAIEWAIHCIEKNPMSVEVPPLKVEEPIELIARLGQKILRNPGDEAAWERKAEEEIYYYTAQLKQGINRLEALRRLGFAYLFGPFGADRIYKAENCFKQVLSEKPDDPVALFGLARTQIMWRGGCNEERKSMLLRAKAGCKEPFVNLYDWPGNDLEVWLRKCV